MENSAFRPNTKYIKLILSIEGISSLANQFFQILLPWYILTSTGSVVWTGVAAFAVLAPGIFSALWGGSVTDKIGRSKTMLICESSQFVIISIITLIVISGKHWPGTISVLIFLTSFFDIPGELSRQALMPSYSRMAGIPLHRTTGFKEALDGIMSFFGPVLGGLLIAAYGTTQCWIAASVMCAAIVFLAIYVFNNRKVRKASNPTFYSNAWKMMRKDPFLIQVIIFTLPLFILGQSWELLILPVYVHTFGHSSVFLGFLEAAFGLGAFIGAISFASFKKRSNFFTILTINYAAYALSAVVLMFDLPKWLVLTANGLSGLPFGAFGATVTTILLSRSSEELRGKTLGLFAAGAAFIESFCALGIGFMLQGFGLFYTLEAAAIIFGVLMAASITAAKEKEIPPVSKPENQQQNGEQNLQSDPAAKLQTTDEEPQNATALPTPDDTSNNAAVQLKNPQSSASENKSEQQTETDKPEQDNSHKL